jgi:hypothetical protein
MKAKLAPLKGKYYGTVIEVDTDEDGSFRHSVSVWIDDNSGPSRREYDFERDGKYYTVDMEYGIYEYEICDSHYETKTSLRVANILIHGINVGLHGR